MSSSLGQPLRMRIPLRVDPELELTPQCVRLLNNPGSDAIPTMTMAMARISIERRGESRILRIDSLYPVNEPVMRVSVEAGCAQHARREFMLLLDPPDTLPQLAMVAPFAEAPATPPPVAAPTAPAAADAAAPADATPPPTGSTPPPAASDTSPAAATVPPAPNANAGIGTTDSQPANATSATSANSPDADNAAELILGGATIVGRVGEPLSMQIPVTGTGAATLDAGCVHLAGAWNGEGAPVLSQARLNLVRIGADTQIDLATQNPVTEPALRVILEVGCGTAVRREYGVLLDKPATATEAAAVNTPAPVPNPQTAIAQSNVGAATAATGTVTAAPAAEAAPATAIAPPKAKRPHKVLRPPVAPASVSTAPAQTPAATSSATAMAAPAHKTAPAPKAKAPAPAADHLVLSAPSDQPDPATLRLAEMDKRIAELTNEVTQLRSELVTERQHAAEAAEDRKGLGAGWIVAILALLGLGLGGLLTWQRQRSGMPWEKSSWEPPTTMPEADRARPAMAPVPLGQRSAPQESLPTTRETPRPASAVAPVERPLPPLRSAIRPSAPVPPRASQAKSTQTSFEELTGASSTITPGAGGPKTAIEVTEMHADDPELGKMHTVFLEPGNLDIPSVLTPSVASGAMDTRVPGPQPVPGAAPRDDFSAPTKQSPATQLPPITQLPPMPSPTIVAPDQRHGAFTFDDGPYTQTPTMLVLDLDLTARALPVDDGEAAKTAAAPKEAKDPKDGDPAGGAHGAEPRGGFKNRR